MQCVLVVHAVTMREIRSREPVLDRHVTGDHVDDGARHEERRDLARTALEPLRVIRFDRADAADPGAHRDAVAVRVGLLDREAGVLHRLHARRDAVVHEGVALAGFFRLEVLADVEVADRAGETGREGAGVEVLDGADAADAVADVVPALGNGVAYGRDQPKARDDDASLRHDAYLRSGAKMRMSCSVSGKEG